MPTASLPSNGTSSIIKPSLKEKFKSSEAHQIIKECISTKFSGQKYSAEKCSQWTKEIVNEIKTKLKGMNLPRYRLIVTAVVGENKGEGVKMNARCFWDADSDNLAQETFVNDSLFCTVAAFGIYSY